MIRLLLIGLILFLAIAAWLLNKHAEKFSYAFGNDETTVDLLLLFKKFSYYLFLSVFIGIFFVFFNTQFSALLYLAFVMLLSAFFSLKIAKKIAI